MELDRWCFRRTSSSCACTCSLLCSMGAFALAHLHSCSHTSPCSFFHCSILENYLPTPCSITRLCCMPRRDANKHAMSVFFSDPVRQHSHRTSTCSIPSHLALISHATFGNCTLHVRARYNCCHTWVCDISSLRCHQAIPPRLPFPISPSPHVHCAHLHKYFLSCLPSPWTLHVLTLHS